MRRIVRYAMRGHDGKEVRQHALRKYERKERRAGGFTLAETLIAVLIMLMVSAVVAAGIPAAKNAYEKVTVAANAQVLLSTAASSLRDELGTAREIDAGDGSEVTYVSAATGSGARIYLDADGVIMRREYIGYGDDAAEGIGRQLVSAKASTAELYVTYDSILLEGDLITVKGLRVIRKTDGSERIADPLDLVIRPAVRS